MTVPAGELRETDLDRGEPRPERWRDGTLPGLGIDHESPPAQEEGGAGRDEGARAPTDPTSLEPGQRTPVHEAALRALNFTVAALSLVVLAPVFLLIAVAIKLDSDGPVFYRQLRVGVDRRRDELDAPGESDGRRTGDLGGRPFAIYKFRTMEVDAEDGLGPTWSGQEDDRITRVGRFLRKHRLDELPQLWNVLKGEMAIVGPRPERPLFFQKLRKTFDAYPKRQTVPPGITGWAQVNRDADQSLDDVLHKLRYDLEYLERRSVWFDVYIMLKTPIVMVKREILAGRSSTEDNNGPSREEES
ncbi:MAG: sugar transferase [Gemmatimonadota bacterium]